MFTLEAINFLAKLVVTDSQNVDYVTSHRNNTYYRRTMQMITTQSEEPS